ncbi:MAG TPA: caspase family protein [Acidobacteriota bacterium]
MSDRLAILIGNGKFDEDSGLPGLFGPRHDVASLGRLLADPGIGNFVVFELVDRDSGQLLPELQRLFAMVDPDTTLLFYYAGHLIDGAGRGLHLATADTVLDDLAHSALPVSFVKTLLRGSGVRDLAVILDCCHHASLPGSPGEEELERALRRLRTGVGSAMHLVVPPARNQTPDAREIATETGLEGRLTRCIVEGISTGAADRDGDSSVRMRELNEYLGMRMGQDRPLWNGPLDGADPEIVANPHPIKGADPLAFQTPVPRAQPQPQPRPRRWLLAGLMVAAAGIVAALVFERAGPPGPTRLEGLYTGPGLPETIGRVAELSALRSIIGRTSWIEHVDDLDGRPRRYPTLFTLTLDPASRASPGTLQLRARQWALVEFSDGVYAAGFSSRPGMNLGEVLVELADGSRFSFEARTDRAERHFVGVVSRRLIRSIRLQADQGTFAVGRWYTYADREYRPARSALGS